MVQFVTIKLKNVGNKLADKLLLTPCAGVGGGGVGAKIAAKTLLTAKNDSRIGVLPPVTTLRWGLGMAAFAAAAGGEAGAGENQRGVRMELASGAAIPL